jgi:hypothetical protein
MSNLPWFLTPPYTLAIFGMFLLFLAMLYTYTGKAWIRFHGWVYRAEEPKRYWLEVTMYYLGAVVMFGLFWYKTR